MGHVLPNSCTCPLLPDVGLSELNKDDPESDWNPFLSDLELPLSFSGFCGCPKKCLWSSRLFTLPSANKSVLLIANRTLLEMVTCNFKLCFSMWNL